MTALPEWMYPPREEGWYADDLDLLVDAPPHTELIDGALVLNLSARRRWHSRVTFALRTELDHQAPAGMVADSQMTVRLDRRNRPEPDVLVSTTDIDDDTSFYEPATVVLVVEVVSPESEDRDRKTKPFKYAEAGIPHFWRVEHTDGVTVIHVYERDELTSAYVATGIFRDRLDLTVPFPISIGVSALTAR